MDFAGGVGVALGDVEITEEEVDSGELAGRGGFLGFVVLLLLDLKAFLNGSACFLEGVPSGGFVPARTGAFLPPIARRCQCSAPLRR